MSATTLRPGAVLLAVCMLGLSALAAPPTLPEKLSYQGVLLDDMGDPRTGSVDLTLRVYDALGGGTLLYKQTLAGVPLTDGVFSVEIGPTGAASDVPDDPLTTSLAEALAGDLPATAPSRFLEVTVGVESPLTRTQILSAPYALRADAAASADLAQTAVDALNVNGLPSEVLTQIFEHTNLDGQEPSNNDPREGLADPDGDGIANFVDPDNDDDGIGDAAELAQGSDINLVTPTVSSVVPSSALSVVTLTVTVQGMGFEPGPSVVFGSETPTPTNLTSTSFDLEVGPQAAGSVDLQVTNANGENDLLTGAFTFLDFVTHEVNAPAGSQFSFDVAGNRTLVGGLQQYGADTDGNSQPETLVPFPSHSGGGDGQVAVAWNPAGQLVGMRCRALGGGDCSVEISTDTDADFDLTDETPVVVEVLTAGTVRLLRPSLAFEPTGEIVAGYSVSQSGTAARVAHDRDGDGQFTGTNELVTLEAVTGTIANRGQVAVDASGRVAYVYFDGLLQRVRVAYDRNGDGDFDDSPGGNPELFTLVTPASNSINCLGVGFAPDGDLAVVWDDAASGPQLARDLDADGDFTGAGEVLSLFGVSGGGCDAEGGGAGLAVVHNGGGGLFLLVDRNDDGDFDDTDEDQQLATIGINSQLAVTFNAAGRALVATAPNVREIRIDPVP